MPTQIQGIEFEVIGSGASEAAQSLDALTASLKKLKGVAGTKIGISSIAKEVREATKGGSASLKKFADGIEAIATAAGKLAGANSGLKSFAEQDALLPVARLPVPLSTAPCWSTTAGGHRGRCCCQGDGSRCTAEASTSLRKSAPAGSSVFPKAGWLPAPASSPADGSCWTSAVRPRAYLSSPAEASA